MKKIRLGVVGVGYLGAFHVEKCARLPMTELVAIAEINVERCQAIAAQYQVEGFTNYQELLGKVEAVCIAVPASYHYKIAHFFLSHGVHVFLEKPMATCAIEARELVSLSQLKNCCLQIGFIERFNPVSKKLKELVKNPVLIESARLAGYSPRGTDVSVVLDLMIHDIDIIHYLFDETLELKTASGCRVKSENLDEVTAKFTLQNKVEIYLTASRASPQKQRIMRIVEVDRIIHADFGNNCIDIYSASSPQQEPQRIQLEKKDLLFEELEAFVTAVQTQTPPIIDGEMGALTLSAAIQVEKMVMQTTINPVQEPYYYKKVVST